MTETQNAPKPSSAPVVLRIIFAIIAALPALAGTLAIWGMALVGASEGFNISSGEAPWVLAIIIVSALVATPAYLVIALILRFARWRKAPTASLVLAILYSVTAVVATAMGQNVVLPGEEYWTLVICALLATLVGAGLPFHHWWTARPSV